MVRILAVWNILLTVTLAVVLISRSSMGTNIRAAEHTQIVRTKRLEIVDQSGKTRAVLGADGANASPKLSLYNNDGREAAFLMLNSQGYGTLYFQSKQTESKVALGYLWGSDSLSDSRAEDSLASWGVRVKGMNGTQTSFGLLNSGRISHTSIAPNPR